METVPSGPSVPSTLTKAPADENESYWLKYSRSGGAYVPPQRAAMMQKDLPSDPSSEAYQRVSWEALRKSLNGLINKINTTNIKEIIVELFNENLLRGRGVFTRGVMRAQSVALPFTAIYAAMMAVINTKIPAIGELLLTRLIHQFRRAYRRNDKAQCLASTMFLAHLVNQKVAHEIVALQILTLLLERPTDDSVEIAVGFMRECGLALGEISPRPTNAIFERFRVILHEGLIDKRVQFMVEVLFQLRKDGFNGHEAIKAELDLISEEDQITHYISLDDELDPQDSLNVFTFDPDFVANEAKYEGLKEEILGGEDEDEGEEEEEVAPVETAPTTLIEDRTSTDLINLRKVIYLTVMSSVDFEECGHKLLKLNIPEGLEIELCKMIVECCSQERTYLKFFGLLAERFCALDPVWRENFESCFTEVYKTVHRMETNRIRNVSKLFGHLLYTDAISWGVFACIHLTEDSTTSASRILIKFLFLELVELLGLPKLQQRFFQPADKNLADLWFSGLFPTDNARDTRFAINYFTAIGLGGLTEGLREQLIVMQADTAEEQFEEPTAPYLPAVPDSPDSYASTVSHSPSPPSPRRRERSRTRSRSRSISRSRNRDRSKSRSRTRRSHRSRSRHDRRYRSRSRSPYRHHRRH